MRILCLPGMEGYYGKALPDLLERGLEIIPALQSEEEMAANMGMLLGVGAQGTGGTGDGLPDSTSCAVVGAAGCVRSATCLCKHQRLLVQLAGQSRW
jgi:hypothetical protein